MPLVVVAAGTRRHLLGIVLLSIVLVCEPLCAIGAPQAAGVDCSSTLPGYRTVRDAAQRVYSSLPNHEYDGWVGAYFRGGGSGGEGLVWSPSEGFVIVRSTTDSFADDGYAGCRFSAGTVRVAGSRIHLQAAFDVANRRRPTTLVKMMWRGDRYLVEAKDLSVFRSYRAGTVDRHDPLIYGRFYMNEADRQRRLRER